MAPHAPTQPRSREPRARDIDNRDWVHDRYEDDKFAARPSRNDHGRLPAEKPEPARTADGTRIRVENLHYELTERDINELFARIAPVQHCQLLYDRADRSRGTAFVSYADPRDARAAVREFDGANAFGQPIRLHMVAEPPPRPADRLRGGAGAGLEGRPLADRVQGGGRSLFERIEGGRRARSHSPRRDSPRDVDRYTPKRRASSRSPPPRRRGVPGPRDNGRRPGERREGGGRGRGRGPRREGEGRQQLVQGRPRKTAEELDSEMMDYFGGDGAGDDREGAVGDYQNGDDGVNGDSIDDIEQPDTSAPAGGVAAVDEDVDMIE